MSVLTESNRGCPRPADVADRSALRQAAVFADDAADARQFLGHALVHRDDVVEGVGELALDTREVAWQAVREVASAQREQAGQQLTGNWGFKRLRVHRPLDSGRPHQAGLAGVGRLLEMLPVGMVPVTRRRATRKSRVRSRGVQCASDELVWARQRVDHLKPGELRAKTRDRPCAGRHLLT